jgi:hypothetical protein
VSAAGFEEGKRASSVLQARIFTEKLIVGKIHRLRSLIFTKEVNHGKVDQNFCRHHMAPAASAGVTTQTDECVANFKK